MRYGGTIAPDDRGRGAPERVSDTTLQCPRCFFDALRPDARFCPHCGLRDPVEAAADTSPLDVTSGGRTYQVLDRIAVGSVCTVYRCRFAFGLKGVEGVFKIARDARSNALVANEADVLRTLHASEGARRFAPFLPEVEASLSLRDGASGPSRRANVLKTCDEIHSPDELYTLAEVRAAYPGGLDGGDVAWVWRRLLNVLGFAHSRGVVHAAVLPVHVLVEPREHKLVLVDWCSAAARGGRGLAVVTGPYREWYRRQGSLRAPPTPGLDVSLGARCMVELLGGDPLRAEFPPAVDPALRRYFGRCVEAGSSGNRADAWKLLDDFDRLIEALWGPRQFKKFAMPPKPTGARKG